MRTFLYLAILSLCIFELGLYGFAAPGDLDTSFGSSGVAVTDFDGLEDTAQSVAIQPDGKIIALGHSQLNYIARFALARYNIDGSLDQTFGNGGKVITTFPFLENAAYSVNLQNDGKIVAAGHTGLGGGPVSFARYHHDGSLDTTFGSNGKVFVSFGSGVYLWVYDTVIEPNGRILAAGAIRTSLEWNFFVIAIKPNGTLDGSFGSSGIVVTSFGAFSDVATSIGIMPDGKVLVAGGAYNGSNYDLALARYTQNGLLDLGFDNDGMVTLPIGSGDDLAWGLAVQTDGTFFIAGQSHSGTDLDALVVKFGPDGQPDGSFGVKGIKLFGFGPIGEDGAAAIEIQPNRKLLVGGHSGSSPNKRVGLARVAEDGALDPTFDGDGTKILDLGNSNAGATGMALYPDGRIGLSAFRFPGNDSTRGDFVIARLIGDTVLIEGDVTPRLNIDGVVTSTDVTQMRRFVTGLDIPSTITGEFQRADCSPRSTFGDGAITSADVVQVRRYATGLDPLTYAGGPMVATDGGLLLDGVLLAQKSILLRLTFAEMRQERSVLSVGLETSADVAAARFTFNYDAKTLGKPSVSLADAASDGVALTVNDSVDGVLVILIDSTVELAVDGKPAELFKILFENGTSTTLDDRSISLADYPSLSDISGNSIPADTIDWAWTRSK